MALTFNDINFKNNTIYINKTTTRFFDEKGKRIITNPKTKKSIRTISIDSTMKNEIYELIEYYKNKLGYFNSNLFVFGGNKTIPPTTLTRYKNKYCDIANVRKISIHKLRHSHAVLLYTNSVPINEITNRLGHSTISMTTDCYLRFMPVYEKNVIKTLNSIRLL